MKKNKDNTINKRLDYVDYAKGIGILLVVLGHTKMVVDESDTTAYFFIKLIYTFHMPLFFVITGLLLGIRGRKLEKAKQKAKLNIGKLFVRLMIPYYIWSVIYMIVEYLQNGNENGKIQDMIRATIITNGNAPLWFLAALFFARLIFHFLKEVMELDEKEILAGSLFLSFFASRLYDLMTKKGLLEQQIPRFITIAVFRLFPSVFFLAFGYFLSRQLNKKDKKYGCVAGILLLFCLMITVELYYPGINMHIFQLRDMPYFLLTGCTGSTAVLLLCRCLPDNIKALRELGQDSMDIMALHYKPMTFMFIAGDLVKNITGKMNFILVWLVCCVMVVPLALLLKYIKKETAAAVLKIKAKKLEKQKKEEAEKSADNTAEAEN